MKDLPCWPGTDDEDVYIGLLCWLGRLSGNSGHGLLVTEASMLTTGTQSEDKIEGKLSKKLGYK